MIPAATIPTAPMALMKLVVFKKPADYLFLEARTLLPLFFVGQTALSRPPQQPRRKPCHLVVRPRAFAVVATAAVLKADVPGPGADEE